MSDIADYCRLFLWFVDYFRRRVDGCVDDLGGDCRLFPDLSTILSTSWSTIVDYVCELSTRPGDVSAVVDDDVDYVVDYVVI